MSLTDTAVRQAKPGPKPFKMSDERGLFVLVQPSGAKLWRLKYRFGGKEQKLSLGTYPEVSLKEARRRRDDARAELSNGRNPSALRKALATERDEQTRHTFEIVGLEYLDRMADHGRESVTIKKSRWLFSLMVPDLGPLPVSEITPAQLLKTLKKREELGHHETARRMRSLAGRIFRYAVATSRATADPSALLKGALIPPKVKHHSAIIEAKGVGALLRAIDGYDGQPLTKLALKLTPHIFVRPGELRAAEWPEFDLENAVWSIPAERMKMRASHRVPLSRQAVSILRQARVLSSKQRFVFSSLYPGNRPMSENTINGALRRLGYTGDEMTAHGFRALASSLLNESGKWNPDAIERGLAHKDNNAVRATYHRAEYWAERVEMAQWWSDYLDGLRDAGGTAVASSETTSRV